MEGEVYSRIRMSMVRDYIGSRSTDQGIDVEV